MSDNETEQAGGCVINHGTDKRGEERRVEATYGLLCTGHAKRLREWLEEISIDYALLGLVTAPSLAQSWGESRGGGDEHTTPLNLTVAALMDTGRGGDPRDRGDELWYELPDIPSILAALHARAEDLRCLLDPSRGEPDDSLRDVTVVGEVNYLLAAFETLVEVDWVDEAFEEFKRLWISLQRAHDRPRPKPLGPCLTFTCDGTVWPRPNAAPWCSKCKREFDTPAEIIKVGLEQEKARAADRKKSAA